MSNIIKYGTSRSHEKTFIWEFEEFCFPMANETCQIIKSSDIFQFCGYSCFLIFDIRSLSSGEDLECTFKLTLLGYPAPYKYNISCDYSIFFKNQFGKILATNSGELRTNEEIVEFDLFDGTSPTWFFNYSIICFSWAEDGCSKLLSQAIQTEAETIHIIASAAQTEDKQISPVVNVCTHAACCINALKRESQTTVAELPFSSDVCINEENETRQFLDEMSNDFRSFFESKTATDCVLSVGETKFPVHRSVLSARSKVLAAMFHHDTSESQREEIIVQDVDATALGHVLYFIYTGKVRGLSLDSAAPMYTVADKYALISLRVKCLNYLLCNLSMENICDAALLAHVHAETELENKVVKFMKERLQELIGTEKWKDFTNGHAKLANKFLRSASMSN